MKKILFVNFNCAWNTHFETELDIMRCNMDMGEDVYSLSCRGVLNKYCALAYQSADKMICDLCKAKYNKGCDLIELPREKRYFLKRIKSYPEFVNREFSTIDEIKAVYYKDCPIGDNLIRTYKNIISVQNLYIKDLPRDYIKNILINAINTYEAFVSLHSKIHFDEVYFFSGRFPEYNSILTYCKANNILFFVHERGASYKKYSYGINTHLNDLNGLYEAWVGRYLSNYDNDPKRQEIAENWYEDKKRGGGAAWLEFTKDQKKKSLPAGFDLSKKNIVIFNSSLHEVCIDDSFLPKECFRDEIAVFKNLSVAFANDENYHFTLRAHPNIALNIGEQYYNLEKLKKDCPDNLTIVMPDDKVDTYELLAQADVVIASLCTTVGVEATYEGKPAILLGKAVYQDLDVAYIPDSIAELIELLRKENLEPKPYENALKYGYCAATYGEDFKYYEPTGLFDGTFMGVNLNKSHKFLPIAGKIKRFYYKQKASLLKRIIKNS